MNNKINKKKFIVNILLILLTSFVVGYLIFTWGNIPE